MLSRAADGTSVQELDFLSLRSQLGPLAAVSVIHCPWPCKVVAVVKLLSDLQTLLRLMDLFPFADSSMY